MFVHNVRFLRYSQSSNQSCTLVHFLFSDYRNLELKHSDSISGLYRQTLIDSYKTLKTCHIKKLTGHFSNPSYPMPTTLKFNLLPIEDDGFHLQTTIKINGKEAVVIIDTGASRSVFDEERIAIFVANALLEDHDRLSTGLGTNTMSSKKVILEKLTLNTLDILNYEATILNLSHVNQSYEKLALPLIDGVLGSDILADYKAVIDYGNKEIVFNA